jgi:hypothetical protein
MTPFRPFLEGRALEEKGYGFGKAHAPETLSTEKGSREIRDGKKGGNGSGAY